MTRNVAIIPARGGSRRIPGKNIKMFHGEPIIGYSILEAIDSGLFGEHVYVSTDSDNIETVARQYGACIIRRSPELAHDSVGTQEVMADNLATLKKLGHVFEFACCIYATAPMMTVSDLCMGYATLRRGEYAMTYCAGPGCVDAGQWYWGTVDAFLRCADPHVEGYPMVIDADRVCDINTPEDWARAERMYERMHAC